ncbi:hypothetical protein IMCC3317_11970 [Kordia antarctica]|uniref:Uncharacterized protein n=1 Tax=Kordia antarctica TaxID=1218801 RepID=A0A7L4ZHD6_9FLAO|nr:hypothetical protein [Kordia antarctica]QHI35849.1 hypothetical protein IMCC3317_11970 [Kordia antarctica]
MGIHKKIQLKPRLSISKIGKLQFWIAIGLGILSAIVFYLFTFYLLDFMIVMSVLLGGDLPNISAEVSFFEKSFLIATSLTVGITMMIRHWFMQATFHFQHSRKKITLRLSNYSLFLYYLILYVAIVFIRFSVFGKASVGSHQPINYNSLFFIIPLYLFFASWTEVSRYFKTANWIPYTFLISIFTVTLMSLIDIKPEGFSKSTFQNCHSEELDYIDAEVEKAKRDYGISYSEETIRTLKQLRTENSLNQLEKVRLAFKTDVKVSLDTIILEKILIHNFKGYYKDRQQSYAYIFPIHAYEQLRKVAPNSHEATELLNILVEFHKLTMLMHDAYYGDKENIIYYHKENVLIHNIHNYYDRSFDYGRMANQSFFLVYHIQKLGIYNHPYFNTKNSFPPPLPIYKDWARERFPELYHNN